MVSKEYTTLSLPLTVVGGRAVLATGVDAIEQSIKLILTTPVGSRFMQREFGSRLDEIVGEANDIIFITLCKQFIKEALKKHEPRIEIKDVSVSLENENGLAYIGIIYRIVAFGDTLSINLPYQRNNA